MNKGISASDFSIVALDKFIQATRDSGYKGTNSAVAELVDNALQAQARNVTIQAMSRMNGDEQSMEISVIDDGIGMNPVTLRQALRFGGSTRFNDRNGLGRYGMGLPNSSLSQARRVMVYTWQNGTPVYMCYLDVDQIATGAMIEVPLPTRTEHPFKGDFGKSGTIVVWSRCDRLDNLRASTIVRKLLKTLGRRFRYYIWDGIKIAINGEYVEPLDPLFLHPDAKYSGADLFGEPIEYEFRVNQGNGQHKSSLIQVRFTELPVHKWYKLSNKDKRKLDIAKGAGISVVRARREVDYGWFFLTGKRRENYDDWWRCEIQFEPELDEAFGITHTKQQIRPKSYILDTLSPDIEAIARALNGRARKAHFAAKTAERFSEAEKIASAREQLLEPLPFTARDSDKAVLNELTSKYPILRTPAMRSISEGENNGNNSLDYKIVEVTVRDQAFFTYALDKGRLILALNPSHPFYKLIYKPLSESTTPRDRELRIQLELLLLSLVRAEAKEENVTMIACQEQIRRRWSNVLATFLNG